MASCDVSACRRKSKEMTATAAHATQLLSAASANTRSCRSTLTYATQRFIDQFLGSPASAASPTRPFNNIVCVRLPVTIAEQENRIWWNTSYECSRLNIDVDLPLT